MNIILAPGPIQYVWKCEGSADLAIYKTIGTGLDRDALPGGSLVAFPQDDPVHPTGVPIEVDTAVAMDAVCYKNGPSNTLRPLMVQKVWYLTSKRDA